MRVILRENIENLGKKGDIVNVASGYGRNYLIPKKMAIEVTPRNMKMIAIEQKALQKGFEKEKASYQELMDRLNTVTLSFVRKTGEKDVIFGSVSSTDIRDALVAQGFDVEKRKIILDEPIKRLGNYTVPIKIFHEERAEVKLEVVKEGEPSAKEEKEPGLDLVEEGMPVSAAGAEETGRPVTEEKEEGIQEKPAGPMAEPESEPTDKEVISEEQKGDLEETTEIPQKPETLGSFVDGEGSEGEKEPAVEPPAEDTESTPLGAQDEPLDAPKTEPEEEPNGSGAIPGMEDAPQDETKGGSEDTPDTSRETKEDLEKTERNTEESGEQTEEDQSKETAN